MTNKDNNKTAEVSKQQSYDFKKKPYHTAMLADDSFHLSNNDLKQMQVNYGNLLDLSLEALNEEIGTRLFKKLLGQSLVDDNAFFFLESKSYQLFQPMHHQSSLVKASTAQAILRKSHVKAGSAKEATLQDSLVQEPLPQERSSNSAQAKACKETNVNPNNYALCVALRDEHQIVYFYNEEQDVITYSADYECPKIALKEYYTFLALVENATNNNQDKMSEACALVKVPKQAKLVNPSTSKRKVACTCGLDNCEHIARAKMLFLTRTQDLSQVCGDLLYTDSVYQDYLAEIKDILGEFFIQGLDGMNEDIRNKVKGLYLKAISFKLKQFESLFKQILSCMEKYLHMKKYQATNQQNSSSSNNSEEQNEATLNIKRLYHLLMLVLNTSESILCLKNDYLSLGKLYGIGDKGKYIVQKMHLIGLGSYCTQADIDVYTTRYYFYDLEGQRFVYIQGVESPSFETSRYLFDSYLDLTTALLCSFSVFNVELDQAKIKNSIHSNADFFAFNTKYRLDQIALHSFEDYVNQASANRPTYFNQVHNHNMFLLAVTNTQYIAENSIDGYFLFQDKQGNFLSVSASSSQNTGQNKIDYILVESFFSKGKLRTKLLCTINLAFINGKAKRLMRTWNNEKVSLFLQECKV